MVALTPEQVAEIEAAAPDLTVNLIRTATGYRCRLFRDGRFLAAENAPDRMQAFRRALGRVPRALRGAA